jgi:hypothetical protein
MAKVQFSLKPFSKSKRHIILDDCSDGDIVYIEEDNVFGIVSDGDGDETEITHFSNGTREWFPSSTPCRKFIGEINFDVDDFEEFI